ncbi:MAG: O-antigen ligase family protein [Deltaproteobacteria bacterium]|nr:O-antigen ligase family protein [Deltaproteobacteria bacterium]
MAATALPRLDLPAAFGLGLAALLALGPLELRDSLPLGPVNLTTTEILAALAAGLGLLATLQRRLVDKTPMIPVVLRWPLAALAAWAAVHLASAVWASGDRGHVAKAGLRIAGQITLAGLAALWAQHPRVRQRAMAGALTGLGIITLLGLAERTLGRGAEFLLVQFRDEPTWMLGEQRLSTVFYHANTCAAYLEITAPLLLVVAAAPGQKRWVRGVFLLWAAVVAVLLSLTYSRAGLAAGMVGALTLVWAARWREQSRLWRGIAIGYALLVLGAYAANPDMRARIGLDERSYRPHYHWLEGCVGHPGERLQVPLQIRNRGTWDLANRQAPAHVVHTWLTRTGQQLLDAWDYTAMPDLPAGATVTVVVPLDLPSRPGDYVVAADILRDRVLRISGVGAPLALLNCTVVPAGEPLPPPSDKRLDISQFDGVRAWRGLDLERRHYWRAALLLWERKPWLGWGSDRFALIHREYVPAQGYDPRARAHSIVLETAVDLGLLGVAVLALLLVTVGRAVRLAFRQRWGSDRGAALAIAAGLCGLIVHSTVDFFFAYTQIAVVVWPLIGLLLGLAGHRAAPVEPPAASLP